MAQKKKVDPEKQRNKRKKIKCYRRYERIKDCSDVNKLNPNCWVVVRN